MGSLEVASSGSSDQGNQVREPPLTDCRDRRSLFPENPRPPPGLDSCVSAQVFRGLAMSSRAALEVEAAESDTLLPFLGVSRPLLHDSGEKSRGPPFSADFAADDFVTDSFFQNEQNRSKNDTNPKSSILRGWIA